LLKLSPEFSCGTSIIALLVEKYTLTSLEILREGIPNSIDTHNNLHTNVTLASHNTFCTAHWKTFILFNISVTRQKTNEPKVIFK
jgi:hypothetical protein